MTGQEHAAPVGKNGQDDAEGSPPASAVEKDDPHKAEKLTKAGRDLDPNAGSEGHGEQTADAGRRRGH